MAKNKNDDFLEGFFNEISNDLNSNESVEEFAQRIHKKENSDIFTEFTQKMKEEVNDSLYKNGYNNLTDLINKGMDTALKYMGPEAEKSGFVKPDKVKDSFTFIQNELAMVRYDMWKRGAYKDGHQEALRTYFAQMEIDKKQVIGFEKILRHDLKVRKKRKKSKNERFEEGYIDALEDLIRMVKDAKMYMMRKVKTDLMLK